MPAPPVARNRHRAADGLWFPHQMTIDTEGEGREEWTISSVRVNPPLTPESFEKKQSGRQAHPHADARRRCPCHERLAGLVSQAAVARAPRLPPAGRARCA